MKLRGMEGQGAEWQEFSFVSMRRGCEICHLRKVPCCKGGQGPNQSNPEKGQVAVLFSEEGQGLEGLLSEWNL